MVAAHIGYCAREWEFGLQVEAKVAGELGAFLQHYDAARAAQAPVAWSGSVGEQVFERMQPS